MNTRRLLVAAGAALAATASTIPSAVAAGSHGSPHHRAPSKHVLLLSVDGLHQSDLDWYVAHHPHSALAALVHRGTSYTHATTTFPSDSFPGMVAQLTGGGPGHGRRLLRRHLQPRAAAARHDGLRDGRRGHRGRRGPRRPTARRTRSRWTPGRV